jgi:hypothetical protein
MATRRWSARGGPPCGGVLRTGDVAANLAILSANPLTAPTHELLAIALRATFRAGERTH